MEPVTAHLHEFILTAMHQTMIYEIEIGLGSRVFPHLALSYDLTEDIAGNFGRIFEKRN
ncbi:MAG: hypothetical protein IPG53_23840 [Ignavibacteriales bacterium]|nr:hypothetical protein [Ignavibacteriales bacterium]